MEMFTNIFGATNEQQEEQTSLKGEDDASNVEDENAKKEEVMRNIFLFL